MLSAMTEVVRIDVRGTAGGVVIGGFAPLGFLSADLTGTGDGPIDGVAGFSYDANLTSLSCFTPRDKFGGIKYPLVRPY